MEILPVILCGGSGTRLWPFSCDERPKQLLPFFSKHSILQETALRFHKKDLPLILVCGKRYADIIEEQMQTIGIVDYTMIIEPARRDTAAAIALAAEFVRQKKPKATMLVVPSDHLIPNVEPFFAAVLEAENFISQKANFVLFGITPTHPETGYGYIRAENNGNSISIKPIEKFVEKPDEQTAKQLIDSGCLWNSGMFMLPTSLYLQELKNYQPLVYKAAISSIEKAEISGRKIYADADEFLSSPAISIDYAVMQETKHASVIELNNSRWSDIGSWESVWQNSKKNQENNAYSGDVLLENCNNSLVFSDTGKLLAVGLENYIVVHTKQATLVLPRSESQNLKKYLSKLKGDE